MVMIGDPQAMNGCDYHVSESGIYSARNAAR